MVERQKINNFMGGIKFGPMHASKAIVLSNYQMSNSFYSTTDYLDQFVQKTNMIHFREISDMSKDNGR